AHRRDQRLGRRLRPHVPKDDPELHRSPVRAPACRVNGSGLFLGGGGGRERKRSGGGGGPAATFEGAACCARRERATGVGARAGAPGPPPPPHPAAIVPPGPQFSCLRIAASAARAYGYPGSIACERTNSPYATERRPC